MGPLASSDSPSWQRARDTTAPNSPAREYSRELYGESPALNAGVSAAGNKLIITTERLPTTGHPFTITVPADNGDCIAEQMLVIGIGQPIILTP